MEVVSAFSKFAHEYNKYNVIQKDVAERLCTLLDKKYYEKILDIGAGDGAIYHNILKQDIEFQSFTALDFSKEMLVIHPNHVLIKKVCLNFNEEPLHRYFSKNEFDLVISSSALQWSNNLKALLEEISHIAENSLFAFFTANTFKTLHHTIKINSPILKKEAIINALNEVFIYELEVVEYKLTFNSVHEMLRYIKKSGVGGGVRQLSYKEIRYLMKEYPLDYLEFEVVLVKVIGKR